MPAFNLDFLDHVAIRVRDQEHSARWYEKVLGLTRCELPAWGHYPVLMRTGRCGIALFPANTQEPATDELSKNVRIDHFAFHLDKKDFEKARAHYESLGLSYEFQNHFYFHSIYTKDPDGHTVELTTLVVEATAFYK